MEKKILIAVVSHKPYPMPSDPMYVPVEVGATYRTEHFFQCRDDQGVNISSKNKNYCELTGIYWAYKNNDYDVLGLVHYRRHFMKRNCLVSKNLKNVLTHDQVEKILGKVDFILPKKRHYYIESNYSHYIHAHVSEPLDKTGKIIQKYYPEYYPAFQHHMARRSGHYFNMFIARGEIAKGYLDWLFDILFRLEKEIDISSYSTYEQRVFGFVSELLLDVYIDTNHLTYREQKYCFMEHQNWGKKILSFLKRRFKKGNQQYSETNFVI